VHLVRRFVDPRRFVACTGCDRDTDAFGDVDPVGQGIVQQDGGGLGS